MVQKEAKFKCEVESISKDAIFWDTVYIIESKSPLLFTNRHITNKLVFHECPNITFPKGFKPSCPIELHKSGKGIIDFNSKDNLSIVFNSEITEVRGSYPILNLHHSKPLINAKISKNTIITFKNQNLPKIGKHAQFENISVTKTLKSGSNVQTPNEMINFIPHLEQFKILAKQKILESLINQNAIKAALAFTPEDISVMLQIEDDPTTLQFLQKIKTLRIEMGAQKTLIDQALTSIDITPQ